MFRRFLSFCFSYARPLICGRSGFPSRGRVFHLRQKKRLPPRQHRALCSRHFLHCLERRQSYEEFSVASLLAAFEAATEPPERSVIEIEPALAKSSRINPLTA